MGKKYIVEIGRLERLYKASADAYGKPNITWLSPETDLTPYTEPDLEQVREEAYEAGAKSSAVVIADNKAHEAYKLGYENGLNDAWDAARKIVDLWRYIPNDELMKIFDVRGNWGESVLSLIMRCLPPSEAIEKIRQYEQEQKEIKIGDEVAFHHDDGRPDTVVVVTYIGQDGFIDGMDGRGTQYAHKNPKRWTKTGRYFPELVSILEKMRGEQDG